jgi:hypothetical protein
MGPPVTEPARDSKEAAIVDVRVKDSPTRVSDTSEWSNEPLDIPQVAASWTPPRCTTSTGVNTGAMPTTMMDQAAWDLSVMDADGTSIAVVAGTTTHSALPSSTGVSTELRDSTRAMDDDGSRSSGTETGEAQSISVEDSSGIVRSGPRADIPHGEPVSDIRLPLLVNTVVAEYSARASTQQGRVRTPIVWGQGIPLRPSMSSTVHLIQYPVGPHKRT